MNETTILLASGDPSAKPDFLATVEPILPKQLPFTLPFELIFDGYTRESWSSGSSKDTSSISEGQQSSNDDEWQSCYLISTDGRNRLPGFLQYLQERKKAAICKFDDDASSKSLLVVPFDPPPLPLDKLPDGIDMNQVLFVKYLRDKNMLKTKKGSDGSDAAKMIEQQKLLEQQKKQQKLIQQQKEKQMKIQQQRKVPIPQKKTPIPTSQSSSSTNKKVGGGSGLLGNLLGKQRKTETHLDLVRGEKTSEMAYDPTTGAAGCINAFRTKISTELEQFKSNPTLHIHKITISLSELIRSVPTSERDKVTLDVFKFTVYEQVEEVGMDKWIAAKEPTEYFMDECIINVYKEGHCPPDVLEDINKAELPDEIKGATRHIVDTQSKAIQRKEAKKHALLNKETGGEDNVVVLNSNKRDRRTLEQIQKDLEEESEDVKRSRFD